MNKTILFLVSFLFTHSVFSNTCSLPKGEVITIGCTYDCGFKNTFRMKTSARKLGYKIKFINLRDLPVMQDPFDVIDALLVPGGADIHPDFYKSTLPQEFQDIITQFQRYFNPSDEGTYRDLFEYDLLKRYLGQSMNQPLLGICRGMQMMSVSQGIPLYQDIRAEKGIKNRYNKWDKISVMPGTLMHQLFPKGKLRAFKYHHQGARMDYWEKYASLHPEIQYTAFSHDGVIAEAMELPGRPVLGVQFHPETSFPRVKHKVFGWFLEEACKGKRR